ncbi:MAG: glycosyltransferase family 39 protein [Anaerolineae bacterium]|nr:glycosyltransferase family 39 protein [Anaerolineae bacterium]
MQASVRQWWNASGLPKKESATLRLLMGTVAILGFALMVIPGLNDFSLWLDEVNMANVAQDHLTWLLQSKQIGGLQPFVYFALLNGWSLLAGETDLALRAFSVIMAIVSAALAYRITVDFSRRAFGGLAAVLLFGSMGFIHYHIHQVHIRGLVLMLSMALLFYYERWWSHPSSKHYAIGVIATSIVSIYTHYYGAFIILALNLHALLIGIRQWKDLRRWIGVQMIAAIFLLPLLFSYVTIKPNDASGVSPSLESVTSLEGVEEQEGTIVFPNTFPTDLPTILGTLDAMVSGRADVYAILLGLGLVGVNLSTAQARERFPLRPLGLLLVYLLGSLGFALLFNLWMQSFMDRRVIFLLPGLAILIGYLLTALPRPMAWAALLIAVSITFAHGRSDKLPGNWYFRQAIAIVHEGRQPNDAIFFQFNNWDDYALKPLNYYAAQMFPAHTPILTLGNYTLDNDHNQDYFANQVLANSIWTRSRFWVIRSGDPTLGLTSTEWVNHLEGKRFIEEKSIPVSWMVVSLFVAEPVERPAPQGVIEPSQKLSLPQSFGDTFELADYQVDRLSAQPGEPISLWLIWRALQPPDQDYAVYAHLLEAGTILHGQTDRDPEHLGRAIPTTFWAVDVLIDDRCAVTVNVDTPPGNYQLKVGFYSRIDGARLPVRLSDGSTDDGVVLATIEVR